MALSYNNETKEVSFHVSGGSDRLVILGTNALDSFGTQLKVPDIRLGYDSGAQIGSAKSTAVVRERTFIPPGPMKSVTVEGTPGVMLWSGHAAESDGCYDGKVEIPVVNTADDTMILQKGQVVGEFG